MYRTDAPGNAGGLYTEGDAGAGIPRTVVSAKAMNAHQEELCNAIEGFGLVLDDMDDTQLLQGLQLLQPLGAKGAANGYASLDGATKVPVAQVPDLDAAKITTGTLGAARIPNLDAAKITSGAFDAARIPNLDASKITSGTFGTAQIGAGAVHAGQLNTLAQIATVAGSTPMSAQITITGGNLVFWPQIWADQNGGGAPVTVYLLADETGAFVPISTTNNGETPVVLTAVRIGGAAFSGTGDTANATMFYVASSPPYDLGDGEVPLFAFAVLDAAGNVVMTSVSPDPPWAYNGPTNVRPTHWIDGRPMRRRRKRVARPAPDATEKQIAAYIETLRNPVYEEIEITQAVKQADMPLIPHPFQGNDLSGMTVVLLDPVSPLTWELLAIHEHAESAGNGVSGLLHRGYLKINNQALNRCSPPGVASHGIKWRNSKG